MFKAPEWTQIPNTLFDSLIPTLREGELRVLLVIMRQTYGWHKEWDRIPITQLMEKTGMERMAVCRSVNSLIKKGMVKKNKIGACGTEQVFYSLCIENEEKTCEKLPKIESNSNISDQYPKDTGTSILKIPSKETLTKETKENIYKRKFGKFVELQDQEYQEWIKKLGQEETDSLIQEVNDYVANHKPYKDYSAAMRTFLRNKKNKAQTPIQEKIQERVDRSKENKAYFSLMLKINPHIDTFCFPKETHVEMKFIRKSDGGKFVDSLYFSELTFEQQFESWLKKHEIAFIRRTL